MASSTSCVTQHSHLHRGLPLAITHNALAVVQISPPHQTVLSPPLLSHCPPHSPFSLFFTLESLISTSASRVEGTAHRSRVSVCLPERSDRASPAGRSTACRLQAPVGRTCWRPQAGSGRRHSWEPGSRPCPPPLTGRVRRVLLVSPGKYNLTKNEIQTHILKPL